jgi:hypothetical protein
LEKSLAEKYKSKLIKILSETRPRLSIGHQLAFKNSFGAVAGYLDNQIFIVCGKFGLALRLSQKSVQTLLTEKGYKPLKYFKNGHIKKDYVIISNDIITDESSLKKLLNRSIKLVSKGQVTK